MATILRKKDLHSFLIICLKVQYRSVDAYIYLTSISNAPSRHSFLRLYWIDYFRDYGLLTRCFYNQGIKNKSCTYFIMQNDVVHQLINALVLQLVLMILYYCPKLINHVRNIFFTLLAVEFLAQYVASFNLWFKIDILTIYLFVWQLISLALNWVWSLLLPPIRIIEKGSFSVITALTAWMWHFICFRYIPLALNLSWLWILSIINIFICLHHRGWLYHSYLTNETFSPRTKCSPGVYYIKGIDKWKKSGSLGLMDFFIFLLISSKYFFNDSFCLKRCISLNE